MQQPDGVGPERARAAVTVDIAPELRVAMIRLAHQAAAALLAGQRAASPTGQHAASPTGQRAGDGAQVLAARGESVVIRVGQVAVKAHCVGTDPVRLAARLALAAAPRLDGILLPPLHIEPRWRAGRWLTAWPFGRTVEPDPETAPWPEAAQLLARLHATPAPPGIPAAGGPARIGRVPDLLAPLGDDPAAAAVLAAWQTLPPWARGRARVPGPARLIHGDWHFGQLVTGSGGRWLLGDVDDLGLGDPLWDLGRPAAFRAIDVVTAQEFDGFLDTYRACGGVWDAGTDPWRALDVPARAYAVQTAARSLLAHHRAAMPRDEVTGELVAACRRIATVHGP